MAGTPQSGEILPRGQPCDTLMAMAERRCCAPRTRGRGAAARGHRVGARPCAGQVLGCSRRQDALPPVCVQRSDWLFTDGAFGTPGPFWYMVITPKTTLREPPFPERQWSHEKATENFSGGNRKTRHAHAGPSSPAGPERRSARARGGPPGGPASRTHQRGLVSV